MSVRNLNYETDLLASLTQSNFLSQNNSSTQNAENVSSEYAKILAEKISEVDSEFEETKNNLSNQSQNSDSSSEKNSVTVPETIKRFMPDGSIMITTYEGSSIVNQIKFKPHLLAVADYSVPPKPSGEPEIKMIAKQNLDLFGLLM